MLQSGTRSLMSDTAVVILRRERGIDSAAIRAVHTAAFARTGGGDVAEARLVEHLRDDGAVVAGLSIVAERDGEIVGHVLGSRGRIDDRPAIGLGPLGVLPAMQRRGVGHALMHAVLGAADALEEPCVVLLGDPGYYSRFGFRLAELSGVQPPRAEWAPHFQLRRLNGWRADLRGTFHYPAAFDRL